MVGTILARFEAKGLRIVALDQRSLDKETLARHYEEHVGKGFYDDLVTFMSRGPVVAMVIEGPEDTWEVVRAMMGATNPRKADPGTDPRRPRDPVHREPRPRQRLARVGRARDQHLLPRSVTFVRHEPTDP